eukprot:9198688-Ditylum_brightwellii.AAC.1
MPGNAVCVAARHSSYPNLQEKEEEGEEPTVLMLYPLAIRDVYKGGKSDGRKFKSRKRGVSHTTNVDKGTEKEGDTTTMNHDNDGDDDDDCVREEDSDNEENENKNNSKAKKK